MRIPLAVAICQPQAAVIIVNSCLGASVTVSPRGAILENSKRNFFPNFPKPMDFPNVTTIETLIMRLNKGTDNEFKTKLFSSAFIFDPDFYYRGAFCIEYFCERGASALACVVALVECALSYRPSEATSTGCDRLGIAQCSGPHEAGIPWRRDLAKSRR